MGKSAWYVGLLLLTTAIALPEKALGHGVETNYLYSSQLDLRSIYSTGEPMDAAKVTVYAPNRFEEPWLTGFTDTQGKFSFLPDADLEGDWFVVIEQEGHGDILTVPVTAEGVDVINISKGQGQDIHYGAVTLNPKFFLWLAGASLGTIALGVLCWRQRQRSQWS